MNYLFVFMSFLAFSFQEKFHFVSKDKAYSFVIDPSARYISKPLNNSTSADIFTVINSSDSTVYQLTVTRIQSDKAFTRDSLYGKGFATGFLDRCKCELVEKGPIRYKNIDGVFFKTKALSDRTMSINVMTLNGGYLYSIGYISPVKTFERYKTQYEEALKSMKFQ